MKVQINKENYFFCVKFLLNYFKKYKKILIFMKNKILLFTYTSILISCTILLFTGCASNPTEKYMNSIEKNKKINSVNLYKKQLKSEGLDTELYLMEKGRIAQLQGDYSVSRESFEKEINNLKNRELDDNTLPGADINVGSVLVNDNMLKYKARLFEVEMIYLFQSFNYLASGSLEGAMVEIRRAEYIMNEALKVRNSDDFNPENYRTVEAEINRNLFENEKNNSLSYNSDEGLNMPINPNKNKKIKYKNEYEEKIYKATNENLEEMADLLAKSQSSILNPYVVYMGGLLHEINNEIDSAYISYKKSLQLMPLNPYLQENVVRLAIKLNRIDELEKYKKVYPTIYKSLKDKPIKPNAGRLVILYEDDWIPQKEEEFISFIAFAIAYPIYKVEWSEPPPLKISSKNKKLGLTSPICYMSALAIRALQEETKWRVIRQTARATAKGAAFATGATLTAVGDQYTQMAGLGIMAATAIYNNASENADLRCWMTLPDNVQILDTRLPSGKHDITFNTKNSNIKKTETILIPKNGTTIVRIVKVGQNLIIQLFWPPESKTTQNNLSI